MNKPQLKVHIGVHKTGSTYIQSLLKNNRKLLGKHGILYPLSGLHGSGHALLGEHYLSESRRAHLRESHILKDSGSPLKIRDNVLYELGLLKANHHATILSAEGLALADDAGVERLADHYLPYFDIEIVVFLRRQDSMAESSRAQAYKVNQMGFNPEGAFEKNNHNFNFANIVQRWGNQFGEKAVSVVEYPEGQGPQALRVLTFELFDLPEGIPADDERVNERLSRDVLEYIFKNSNLRYGTSRYQKALRRLIAYSSEHPSEPRFRHFYSPRERMQILETHSQSNAAVASQYRPGLFESYPAVNLEEEWEPYPGLAKHTVDELDALLSDLRE